MLRALLFVSAMMLAGILAVFLQMYRLERAVLPVAAQWLETTTQDMTTEWRSARGSEMVRTARKSGEALDVFADRHNALVGTQQWLWPPI